jgi:Protein of unknown function (DUF3455)
MNDTAIHRLGSALIAVALMAACAHDTPASPKLQRAPGALSESQAPDLGACQKLEVPEGSQLAFHAYARGVQIYRWSGTSWVFVAPAADLFADEGGDGKVGTHYAGPTWESNSGSKVVAAVIDRCTAEPNAIPWLILGAVTAGGPGIFDGTTSIQRLNTVGGVAPAAPGSVVGEVANVPYTAEYYFYRAP